MKRLNVALRSLALIAWAFIATMIPASFAYGALIYQPAAIILEEVRSPEGVSTFTFTALGAGPSYRYKFFNALGEDFTRSNESSYTDWNSVAERLFGTWRLVISHNSEEEEYSFLVSPFAYTDITVPFPVITPHDGTRVSSPFLVNREAAGLWESQNVHGLKRQYLGSDGFRFEFGQVDDDASILIRARNPGASYSEYVSGVTPPSDPQFHVNANLLISRGSTVTLIPVNVPEPGTPVLLASAATLILSKRRIRLSKPLTPPSPPARMRG